jgi:hypothetical protein
MYTAINVPMKSPLVLLVNIGWKKGKFVGNER